MGEWSMRGRKGEGKAPSEGKPRPTSGVMLSSLQNYLSGVILGNHWSNQFLRALSHGNSVRASELYRSKLYLKENMDPNHSLGSEHHDNTYLHYAALYGMEDMYQDLINLKGKPDMKNLQRRNCLHMICLNSAPDDRTKCRMLELTFKEGLVGMDLQHLLREKDENGDTALHLAAGAGLQGCVNLLINYKADMVATNEEGLTPADMAKARDYGHIASSLEAKMVFLNEDEDDIPVDPDPGLLQEIADAPIGMHDRDLRSMKDTLLIEASEMLGVNLQSAEVLLRNYDWSKENLLQAWIENSQLVCDEAGVDMPAEGYHYEDDLATMSDSVGCHGDSDVYECGICCISCDTNKQPLLLCGHYFCQDCWKQYLEDKIGAGQSQAISCPEYGCFRLVPLEVIEGVVSREMALKFLSFDIKAFVDSNPNIRWCPCPGCSQAVSRTPLLEDHTQLSPSHSQDTLMKGHTVHCGNNHYFCWECLGEAHEPSTCEQWATWLQHCEEMKHHVGEATAAQANEAASSKWLAHNSKPCPKCKSPIEKTEGCNHMCCKKCRHDFCWVCLDEWKHHNTSTGGYFNCNRYDSQRKAGNLLYDRQQQVMKNYAGWERISKFIHFYERYKEHINSLKLEEPFLNKAQEKMVELACSIQHMEYSTGMGASGDLKRQIDLSFIGDAVRELLKCRRVLKTTYCYGYYLTGVISTKQFEHMQGALEQVTEMLAEAVARPHLRKPRQEIIRLTREAREKRTGLVKNVHSGLPLSHHPFGGRDLPFDSQHADDARHRRFLHDLDTYTPPQGKWPRPHRGTHRHGDQYNEDQHLLKAIEISREDYEADKQMLADVERAKSLSLLRTDNQTHPFTSPLDVLPQTRNFLEQQQQWSHLASNSSSSSSLGCNGDPTVPSKWNSSDEYEENMRKAIEESLNTHPTRSEGSHYPPPSTRKSINHMTSNTRHHYNRDNMLEFDEFISLPHHTSVHGDNNIGHEALPPPPHHEDTLPPTLRQMFLENSERLGTNV